MRAKSFSSLRSFLQVLLCAFAALAFLSQAFAQDRNGTPVAKVGAVVGNTYLLRGEDKIRVTRDFKLFATDQLVTSKNARVEIIFADGSNIVASENSSMSIEDYRSVFRDDKVTVKSVLNLVRGKARFFFKPRTGGVDATVKTKTAVMGVRGTTFFVDGSAPKETKLVVLTGSVAVANPSKPKEAVVVKPNQMTTISEAAAPAAPVVAPPTVVQEVVAEAKALPDKNQDGFVPDDLELPAPEPEEPEEVSPVAAPTVTPEQREPDSTAMCKNFPCPPLPKRKRVPLCDTESFNSLKTAAQNFDPEAVVWGRTLVKCPGMQDEALFWLSFYHNGIGEAGQAAEVGKFVVIKKDEVLSERDDLIQKANAGDAQPLQSKVGEAESGYAKDGEAQLVLARSLVRARKFDDARKFYDAYLKIPKLKNDSADVETEVAYTFLYEGSFDEAARRFEKVLAGSISGFTEVSAKRGYAMARERQYIAYGIPPIRESAGLRVDAFSDKNVFSRTSAIIGAVTRYGDIEGGMHQLTGYESGAKVKLRASDFSYAYEKRFNYGMGVGGKAGYFAAEKGNITFDAHLDIKYPWGLRPYIGIDNVPMIRDTAVRGNELNLMRRTIYLGGEYENMVSYRFELRQVADNLSHTKQALLGRILLLRGMPPEDYLNLRLFADMESHSQGTASYFSPKSYLQFGVGLEYSGAATSWMRIEAKGDYGIVSQKANTIEVEAGATTPPADLFSKRLAAERGTLLRFGGGFVFPVNYNFKTSLTGTYTRIDSEDSKVLYSPFGASLNLNYSL